MGLDLFVIGERHLIFYTGIQVAIRILDIESDNVNKRCIHLFL